VTIYENVLDVTYFALADLTNSQIDIVLEEALKECVKIDPSDLN